MSEFEQRSRHELIADLVAARKEIHDLTRQLADVMTTNTMQIAEMQAALTRSEKEPVGVPEGWVLVNVLVRDGYGPSWRKLIRDHPGMLAPAPEAANG